MVARTTAKLIEGRPMRIVVAKLTSAKFTNAIEGRFIVVLTTAINTVARPRAQQWAQEFRTNLSLSI